MKVAHMLTDQLAQKVLVKLNPAQRDSSFNFGAQKSVGCDLYFVCHVNLQNCKPKQMQLVVELHTNLVSVALSGQPNRKEPRHSGRVLLGLRNRKS